MKKMLTLVLALCMALSAVSFAVADELPEFGSLVLGENADLKADLVFAYHRTDRRELLDGYVKKFQEIYPNVNITYDLITDYAENALLRVGTDNWTIMGIPTVAKDELPNYFVPFGTVEALSEKYSFMDAWAYNGMTYGIPSTGSAQGIVYNKAVFEKAGIKELPKTPDEFIAALKLIKENTDAIPLYTNYAAGWTMGAWDAYLGGSATGDATFMNQVLLHKANPFSDNGDGTGPYAVYKILYDAVKEGLIEEDYTTTDWEGCKGMINNGKIGCMVLGSWAYPQMQEAGPNPDDIGYMSFPITVNGKQYATAGADYCFGINVKATDDQKLAAMYYIKWLTEKSNFSYDEGGVPIMKDGEYPALYAAFEGIDMVADAPAAAGEETLLNELNSESELAINAGGNTKIQEIVEHAFNGDKEFDDIMADWNEAWSDAQAALKVEVNK